MILGAVLILVALALFFCNRHEEEMAAEQVDELMPLLMEVIENEQQSSTEPSIPDQPMGTPVEYLDPSALIMKEVKINGYPYIGYLSIPTLELNLPVMSDWTYNRLKIAPCRYHGSVRGENLVIMAHNFARHFGKISELTEGDQVIFTDMDGVITIYQVVAQDVLDPYAVEEMTAGEFDLTLFTCTYGGKSRMTIYCDIVKSG